MIWNVFRHDFNRGEIKVWNVFEHGSFSRDVEELLSDSSYKSYEDFSERLRRIAQYYFWCKSEHEVVITSLIPYIDNKEFDRLNAEREKHRYLHYVNLEVNEKIDIYDQLQLNWDIFAKYVWSFKVEVKELELSI